MVLLNSLPPTLHTEVEQEVSSTSQPCLVPASGALPSAHPVRTHSVPFIQLIITHTHLYILRDTNSSPILGIEKMKQVEVRHLFQSRTVDKLGRSFDPKSYQLIPWSSPNISFSTKTFQVHGSQKRTTSSQPGSHRPVCVLPGISASANIFQQFPLHLTPTSPLLGP